MQNTTNYDQNDKLQNELSQTVIQKRIIT